MPKYQQIKKDGRSKAQQQTIRKPDQDEQFTKESQSPPVQLGKADPHVMPPSHILHLQRTIGNAAVQRLLAGKASPSVVHRQTAGGILVQRRLWNNEAAKFQTENDLGAANSEYQVTSSGYRRFAPVNILRGAYDEVFFNSNNRSFVYLTGMPEDINTPEFIALLDDPQVQSVVGGTVTFTSATDDTATPVVADIGPSEGADVYDCEVDDNGVVTHPHVGHPVKALGQALPTLDDPDEILKVKKSLQNGNLQNLDDDEAQENVEEAQKQKAIKNSPYI